MALNVQRGSRVRVRAGGGTRAAGRVFCAILWSEGLTRAITAGAIWAWIVAVDISAAGLMLRARCYCLHGL